MASLTAFGLVAGSIAASAAGFAVPENSTAAMMTSTAGATAFGYDPSFQIFNPATLADLKGVQATVDLKGFFPSVVIDVTAANAPVALGSADITGLGPSGEMTMPAFAPTAFASWQLSDRLTLGLGLYSPFAAKIQTKAVWAGEYQLLSTEMITYDGQLSAAYRVTDWLAVGAASNVQYIKGDFRRLEFVGVPSMGFVKGDDIGIGYSLGLTITPDSRTHIGLSYRSAIGHTLDGTAGVAIAPAQGALTNLTTPDSITLGVARQVTGRLTLLADLGWTGWSKFHGLAIDLAVSPDQVRVQSWRDTWHVAFGGRYALDDGLILGAGVLLDQGAQSGVSNAFSPDADRVEVSVGLEKRLSDHVRLSGVVSHLMVNPASIAVTETNPSGNFGNRLTGTFRSQVTMAGISATFSW